MRENNSLFRGAALSALAMAFWPGAMAQADETQTRAIFQAMSDYLAAQTDFAFDYDTSLDIVTTEEQKLSLASSGSAAVGRPDRLHATRTGGFASVEAGFDGTTLTLLNKDENLFSEVEMPGTIDQLIEGLRATNHPLPAADLLSSDVAGSLLASVSDMKDLGSGVIGGVECDHLAFRAEEVDWQIWIAQGAQPYPCRYMITTRQMTGWPQYTVTISNWQTGEDAAGQLDFTPPATASEVALDKLPDFDDLAGIYSTEGAK